MNQYQFIPIIKPMNDLVFHHRITFEWAIDDFYNFQMAIDDNYHLNNVCTFLKMNLSHVNHQMKYFHFTLCSKIWTLP